MPDKYMKIINGTFWDGRALQSGETVAVPDDGTAERWISSGIAEPGEESTWRQESEQARRQQDEQRQAVEREAQQRRETEEQRERQTREARDQARGVRSITREGAAPLVPGAPLVQRDRDQYEREQQALREREQPEHQQREQQEREQRETREREQREAREQREPEKKK